MLLQKYAPPAAAARVTYLRAESEVSAGHPSDASARTSNSRHCWSFDTPDCLSAARILLHAENLGAVFEPEWLADRMGLCAIYSRREAFGRARNVISALRNLNAVVRVGSLCDETYTLRSYTQADEDSAALEVEEVEDVKEVAESEDLEDIVDSLEIEAGGLEQCAPALSAGADDGAQASPGANADVDSVSSSFEAASYHVPTQVTRRGRRRQLAYSEPESDDEDDDDAKIPWVDSVGAHCADRAAEDEEEVEDVDHNAAAAAAADDGDGDDDGSPTRAGMQPASRAAKRQRYDDTEGTARHRREQRELDDADARAVLLAELEAKALGARSDAIAAACLALDAPDPERCSDAAAAWADARALYKRMSRRLNRTQRAGDRRCESDRQTDVRAARALAPDDHEHYTRDCKRAMRSAEEEDARRKVREREERRLNHLRLVWGRARRARVAAGVERLEELDVRQGLGASRVMQ